MNREELLAKCPRLAAIFQKHTRSPFADTNPAHMTEMRKTWEAEALEESNGDVSAALDEVLALLNGEKAEPRPAEMRGAVAIDGRLLCSFTGVSVERDLGRWPVQPDEPGPWQWTLSGCQFRPRTIACMAGAAADHVAVRLGVEFKASSHGVRGETRVDAWDSDWMKPGASVRMTFHLEGGKSVTLEGMTVAEPMP